MAVGFRPVMGMTVKGPQPAPIERQPLEAPMLSHPYYVSPRSEQRALAREQLTAMLDRMAEIDRNRPIPRRILRAIPTVRA